MRTVDVAERRARLARRHLLVPEARTDDVPAIADALAALHSSDPVTVYLSALARMANPDLAAVEAALYTDRSVLRHHSVRRTLWVATPDVTRRLHAAATLRLVATERRRTETLLAESGIADAAAWLAAARRDVLAVLHADVPMGSRELGRRVPALRHPLTLGQGKKYEATIGAHTRVLLLLGFEGAIVRTRPTGTWINGEYAWAAMDSWLPGGLTGPDERTAAAELADRWLRRFGPAAATDLQWWTGWTATLTRRALADAGAVEVALAEGTGWVAAGDEDPVAAPEPWVAVLPSLDPTTMGWKQREWYLPAAAAEAFDRNGNAGPTLWVDGQVVGAWAQRRDGSAGLHWFTTVPAARRRQLQRRLDEVAGWVGESRYSVRFPGLIQPRLLAPAPIVTAES